MQSVFVRALSQRIKQGDEKAFELLFRALYPSLLHFCTQYLFDRETAKNIVQSSFLKLWEQRANVDENHSLKAFLYTVARNDCISYLRHLKAEARYFKKISATYDDQMLAMDAINELDFSRIDLDRIESVIETTIAVLPEHCREVFIMSRYRNLKNQEIADRLQISVKAVEANLTRALKIFKSNLKEFLPILL